MIYNVSCKLQKSISMHRFPNPIRLEKINIALFIIVVLYISSKFVLVIQHKVLLKTAIKSTDIIVSTSNINKINIRDPKIINSPQFLKAEYLHKVQRGDNLIKILTSIGFDPSDVLSISKQISKLYNISNIYPGQDIKFVFLSKDGGHIKVGDLPYNILIHIEDNIINGILKKDKIYTLQILKKTIYNKSQLIRGHVKESLYNSAILEGVSPGVIMDYINLFSEKIDFKKDVKSDSEFKILFNFKEDLSGKKISDGGIIYAYLSINNKKYEIYQYKDNKGNIGYYYSDGNNIKQSLLSAPIKKARISSQFGMRFHPILKLRKMHKGIDYAAPKGTPIFAAGDGVIQITKYTDGYGKYLAIKHNNRYSTLYAHLSNFKQGIKKGVNVKKGDVIGYVGNTGRSTAYHLHYEIRRYGKPIDPIKEKTLVSMPLEGDNLLIFNNQKKEINSTLEQKNNVILSNNNINMKH